MPFVKSHSMHDLQWSNVEYNELQASSTAVVVQERPLGCVTMGFRLGFRLLPGGCAMMGWQQEEALQDTVAVDDKPSCANSTPFQNQPLCSHATSR